jgi:hypothetical protein
MIYPYTGLTAPIMGTFVGVSIVMFFATIYYSLTTLYHGLRSGLSTAWATYGDKTKQAVMMFLITSTGAVATAAYRWVVYGF